MEVGTMDSLKHYVAIGLGYAVISAMSLTDKDKEKFAIIFLPPSLSAETTYGIVTRRDRLTNPTLDRFIALLLDTNL
ncbi:LysR family transcriptional regulator substrate-binding protein [Vibrio fluvialis]|uniref:LysR family transcriptional regulator substrate-binding protein n=1 Tax=Vibrio fluvialis TaxID=676 RepID=UPI00398C2C2E